MGINIINHIDNENQYHYKGSTEREKKLSRIPCLLYRLYALAHLLFKALFSNLGLGI